LKFFNEYSDYIFLVVATDDLSFGLTIDPFADPRPTPVINVKSLTRPIREITKEEAYELAKKYSVLEYLEMAVEQIRFMEQAPESDDLGEWEEFLKDNTAVNTSSEIPTTPELTTAVIDVQPLVEKEFSELEKTLDRFDKTLMEVLVKVYSPEWLELNKQKEELQETIRLMKEKMARSLLVEVKRGTKGDVIGVCIEQPYKGYIVLFSRELKRKLEQRIKELEENLKPFGVFATNSVRIIDYSERETKRGTKYLKAFRIWEESDTKFLKELQSRLEELEEQMRKLEKEAEYKFFGIDPEETKRIACELYNVFGLFYNEFMRGKCVFHNLYYNSVFRRILKKYDAVGIYVMDSKPVFVFVTDLKKRKAFSVWDYVVNLTVYTNISIETCGRLLWFSSKYIVAPNPTDTEKQLAILTLKEEEKEVWSFLEGGAVNNPATEDEIIRKNESLLKFRFKEFLKLIGSN